jgi:hypothetical protein
MKKIITLLLFSVFCISFSHCQEEEEFFSDKSNKETEKPKRKLDKWTFGGNFWMTFGTNSYVEVSPIVMYKATPKLMVGPGFTYYYQKSKYYNYETSSYGPRVLATYTLFSNLHELININIGDIIIHSEYEYLNLEKIYPLLGGGSIKDGRTWVSSYLLGGGIFQPIGNRGGISIVILYNFIESEFTPYTNPVVRVGFYF